MIIYLHQRPMCNPVNSNIATFSLVFFLVSADDYSSVNDLNYKCPSASAGYELIHLIEL